MSLSSGGGLLAVGAYGDDAGIGACWVFAYDGQSFKQIGPKLVGTGYSGKPFMVRFIHTFVEQRKRTRPGNSVKKSSPNVPKFTI